MALKRPGLKEEIVRLAAPPDVGGEGLSRGEICERLGIALSTTYTHLPVEYLDEDAPRTLENLYITSDFHYFEIERHQSELDKIERQIRALRKAGKSRG